jgi:hypothetical protein
MNLISCLLSGFFITTAVLLGFTSFSIDWLLELYAPTDPYGNPISFLENQRRGEMLSREVKATYQRLCSKDRIIEALRTGEMPLCEAAAAFRSLHEDSQTWHHPFRLRPAHDDGVGWCCLVIEWGTSTIGANRSMGESKIFRQRLEAELQEQMDYFGTVTLPE